MGEPRKLAHTYLKYLRDVFNAKEAMKRADPATEG